MWVLAQDTSVSKRLRTNARNKATQVWQKGSRRSLQEVVEETTKLAQKSAKQRGLSLQGVTNKFA
eukprot:12466893-Prorocentrum_lima.AAC.1